MSTVRKGTYRTGDTYSDSLVYTLHIVCMAHGSVV